MPAFRLPRSLLAIFLAFGTSSTILAQLTLDQNHLGDAGGDRLGTMVASAGDVNADGYDDVVVGIPDDSTTAPFAGAARVYSGFDGSILHTFHGLAAGDSFGDAVDGAGDVDGDGYDDLIVGALLADPNGSASGQVRVFSGFDGSVIYTIDGLAAGDALGSAVAGGGDLNGDGVPDLIVGVETSDDLAPNGGAVRGYSGLTGTMLFEVDGATQSGRLGGSVSNAGDVNGDGYDDLIAGAYRGKNSMGVKTGEALVILGPNGTIFHSLYGDAADDEFGRRVSGLGDINGDGYGDVIVGAHQHDANGLSSGNARVFSGIDATILHDINGAAQADQLGYAVGRAGDVDGDGFADFIIGIPYDDTVAYTAGSVRVYSGKTGTLLHTLNGSVPYDTLGIAVSGAGDVDGDGFADVIIGKPTDDSNGTNSGAALVYLAPTFPVLLFEGESGHTELQLSWTPDGGNIMSYTGTVSCNGATPGALGTYGTSLARIDYPLSFGFSLLIANDAINLIETGNFGFGFAGEIDVPGVTRQHPFLAGTLVHLQFFEIAPFIRGSNGLRLLLVP